MAEVESSTCLCSDLSVAILAQPLRLLSCHEAEQRLKLLPITQLIGWQSNVGKRRVTNYSCKQIAVVVDLPHAPILDLS